MARSVVVGGVGMVPFRKPGDSKAYYEMGADAARMALADARIDYSAVRQAYVGYVYGDSTSGQRALYEVGMTGVPIVNVNNNCSSGSTALFLARQAVESGMVDCAIAVGFEQMQPGALGEVWTDRPSSLGRFNAATDDWAGHSEIPLTLRFFGGAGAEYLDRYGAKVDLFAKVKAKASRHAAANPLALLRNVVTAEEVLESKPIWPGVLTRLMACPPTCGGAAAVVMSEEFARRNGVDTQVRIKGQTMMTDLPGTFGHRSMIDLVGSEMARAAAEQLYSETGTAPEDVDVCELHDCFAQNEVFTYEALGFCKEGEATAFVDKGDNTFGGQVVTNPSGGLLSKGHPLGATGLAQCYELTQQLRGAADSRQVEGARLALQHNLGIGGAVVCTMYEKH
ncbi:MAG: lipid-transfer protein [Bradyrhizobium sp.]|uniref:lipid-transfer protein n=1 Tax=Bradyrhizobium sp. TaxID=376 RepID=UPI0025C2B7E5|nr:lipid-transfer protein [Bradyrhizobium sp.]MBI5261847.1 lipid-transfer protein [Bradyrhizobium sp.]